MHGQTKRHVEATVQRRRDVVKGGAPVDTPSPQSECWPHISESLGARSNSPLQLAAPTRRSNSPLQLAAPTRRPTRRPTCGARWPRLHAGSHRRWRGCADGVAAQTAWLRRRRGCVRGVAAHAASAGCAASALQSALHGGRVRPLGSCVRERAAALPLAVPPVSNVAVAVWVDGGAKAVSLPAEP